MESMTINKFAKYCNTHYSVIKNRIDKGQFPLAFITKGKKSGIRIINCTQAKEWFKKLASTSSRRNIQSISNGAKDMTGVPVMEGDFCTRKIIKRLDISQVTGVTDALVLTDNGLQKITDPWTLEGFNEHYRITTPKAVINLLIKEFTTRERPEVVQQLQKTLELIDKEVED